VGSGGKPPRATRTPNSHRVGTEVGFLEYLRKSMRKRSSGAGGALGIFNELYNPSAHSAQIIVEQQQRAVVPKPSPSDKDSESMKKDPAK